MYLDEMVEEYLLTLEHDENRHYDSEDYSEREIAAGELEAFFEWLAREKGGRVRYERIQRQVR